MFKNSILRSFIHGDIFKFVKGGKINMKKIISLLFLAVFVQSAFCTIGISTNFKSIDSEYNTSDSFLINLLYPDFEIAYDNGIHTIKMEGYNYLSEPGKPMLPFKNILIALPPDSIVESVNVKGLNIRQVPGFFKIGPASKIFPTSSVFGCEKYLEEIDKEWNENYELTYFIDKPYPDIAGELIGQGTYHKISYVSLSVYPFVYHPVSCKLFVYNSAEIEINYLNKKSENLRYNLNIDKKASELFINYESIKHLYKPYLESSSKMSLIT